MDRLLTLIHLCYPSRSSVYSQGCSLILTLPSKCYFLANLVSLVYSTPLSICDDYFAQLLIPNWKVRLTGFIASSIVLSLLSTLIFSIINAVILFVFWRFNSKEFLELTLFLDVTVRIIAIFCNRSYYISFTFRNRNEKNPMTALIADVILLVISLSGILRRNFL